MCAWKYKQIMSKIIVAKLKLMKSSQIVDLVDMNSHHIRSMLEKSSYKTEISKIGSNNLGANFLEDALIKNFLRTCEEIMEASPKHIRLLLHTLLMKFESNCIKAILRAKQARLDVNEAMTYIMPAGRMDEARCKKILEISENIADVIKSLSDLEYGSVLEKAFSVYKEEKTFYFLEISLDRYVYSKIWSAIGKLSGLDKKIARTVIGLEIDSANVKTILRCKSMEIKDEQISRYIVPISKVFGERELQELIWESSIQSFINSLVRFARKAMARDHQYVFTEIQEQNTSSITTIEKVLDKGLIETSLRMIKRYTQFFNIGLLLAFLNLKWFEIRNLRAIIRGTEAGISPEKVKKTLILVK